MSMHRSEDSTRLVATSLVLAVLLHLGFVAALMASPRATPAFHSTTTRVHMVKTQAGEQSVGVVTSTPDAVAPTPAPRAADRPDVATKAAPPTSTTRPKPPPKLATVTPDAAKSKANMPIAGAGAVGGKGADLANIDLGGTDFPSPGYVRNIVNRIAEQFHAPPGANFRAEVMFIIKRDGSVDLDQAQMLTRSGNYAFDNAALGALEAVVNKKLFGPLPAAYPNDALTVIFKFDPSIIRP
jgi:outer membrane biosynthesis protein TonB